MRRRRLPHVEGPEPRAGRLAEVLLDAPELGPEAVVALLDDFTRGFRRDAGRPPRLVPSSTALALLDRLAAATRARVLRLSRSARPTPELSFWPDVLPLIPELGYPVPLLEALGLEIGQRHGAAVGHALEMARLEAGVGSVCGDA